MTEEQNKLENDSTESSQRNKLDELPDDIKYDLHFLIARGYGARKIKTKLEGKWEDQCDIFPVSHTTYNNYRTLHKDEIEQQRIFNDERAQDAIDAYQELDELLNAVDQASSVKDQLSSLRRFVLGRIKVLQSEQERGFLSPQAEAVMNSWVKDCMKIIDKTIQYEKEIEKDRTGELRDFLDNWFYELANGLLSEVREIYGDDKLMELTNRFKAHLKELSKRALSKTIEETK